MKKVAGIIPARINSTRLKGKLLELVDGKPVIQYTYENALKSDALHEVLIATDSRKIALCAESFGAKVLLTKEAPSGTDRIAQALTDHPFLQDYDALINLQGDHPTTEPATIQAIINSLFQKDDAVVSTAVSPLQKPTQIASPHIVKCVFDSSHQALYFSRQPIPFAKATTTNYFRHVGIYCYRTDFLHQLPKLKNTPLQLAEDLEQMKIIEHGYKIQIALVDDQGLGIDTQEDLETFKELLCR